MPDDLDHEVIDSPQALFRHLYEAHGLVEALDLDPATAPLQFWLRRHSELERGATRAAVRERPPAAPSQPPPGRSGAATPQAPATTSRSGRVGTATTAGSAGAAGGAGQGAGPRFRPFTDPLVEAIAAALVGRGMDERWVRRGLSTFTAADGRHGEEALRAAFITPMLEAVVAQLAGDPPSQSQSASPPAGTSPPMPAAARAEPSAPQQGAWVAQPLAASEQGARGQPPHAGARAEPEPDFMAIADVLQERRRSRRGARLQAATPPAPGARPPRSTPPAPTPRSSRDPDDDVMALADALQRRRAGPPR